MSKYTELAGKCMDYLKAFYYLIFRNMIAIQPNRVMLFTFQGQYTCNPKGIGEVLHRKYPEIQCVWVYFSDKSSFPKGDVCVKFQSREYYRMLYSSAVLVDNAFNFAKRPFHKKAGQYFVETMHGSLGIKRIDAGSGRTRKRNKNGYKTGEMTDYIISNSTFENDVYRTSFWENTPVVMLGHARNDILISCRNDGAAAKNLRRKILEFYGLEDDVHIAMYAPTFMRGTEENYESLDDMGLKAALEKRFGGTWYIMKRLHPRDVRNGEIQKNSEWVLDGKLYADINELMVAVDVGITDYSSWIFDYVLMGRPCMIFAPDIEQYRNSTGFYYPIESTPFPIARNNCELQSAVSSIEPEEFKKKALDFVADKGCIDDGCASDYAAEMIAGLLHGKKPSSNPKN